MVAGAVDHNLTRDVISGMERMGAACNKFNDEPHKSSRSFDESRAGPVMSDGGALLVLESLKSAKERGAKIYGEITGYA